jgi:hypothetical protein
MAGVQYQLKEELATVAVALQDQFVNLKMASLAETCNVYICNKEKSEKRPKFSVDGKGILQSQPN